MWWGRVYLDGARHYPSFFGKPGWGDALGAPGHRPGNAQLQRS